MILLDRSKGFWWYGLVGSARNSNMPRGTWTESGIRPFAVSIEAVIGERERLGNGSHSRRGIDGPLIDHDRRWFDRDYVAFDGLVGTRPPSDVHHRVGITERAFDL